MQKRNLLLLWFIVLNLFTWTAPKAGAVPLSLDQNIKAILAKQADIKNGFDFVVLGDSRDGADVYARLLTRAKSLHPLFVVHTGDFVKNGDPVEYEDYMKQIAALNIPILHLPGNHDVRNGEDTYRRYVGGPNWSFDLGRYTPHRPGQRRWKVQCGDRGLCPENPHRPKDLSGGLPLPPGGGPVGGSRHGRGSKRGARR